MQTCFLWTKIATSLCGREPLLQLPKCLLRGNQAAAVSAKAGAPTRWAFARRVRLRAGVALQLPTDRTAPLPRLRLRGTRLHLPQKTRPPPPQTPEGTASGTDIRRALPPVRPPRAPPPPQRATAALVSYLWPYILQVDCASKQWTLYLRLCSAFKTRMRTAGASVVEKIAMSTARDGECTKDEILVWINDEEVNSTKFRE